MSEETQTSNGSDNFVSSAIIVACVIGIIIVAALIILSPREKEAFTQLWLKPWKLNLTNATSGDAIQWIVDRNYNVTKILTSSVLGNQFFVFRRVPGGSPEAWFTLGAAQGTRIVKEGDTVHLGVNSLFLDAIDYEGGQVLFWEYPRNLKPGAESNRTIRFAFVIENNQGIDYEYEARTILMSAGTNVTKTIQRVSVQNGEQKTCVVSFPLSRQEAKEAMSGNYTKVSMRLDTGEEVFFWIGLET